MPNVGSFLIYSRQQIFRQFHQIPKVDHSSIDRWIRRIFQRVSIVGRSASLCPSSSPSTYDLTQEEETAAVAAALAQR